MRAWCVYEGAIRRYAQTRRLNVEDIFLCEQAPAVNGVSHCRVYTCGSCRKAEARDVQQYDLFDGVTERRNAGGFVYENIHAGDPMPAVLSCLTGDERRSLSIVKVNNQRLRKLNATYSVWLASRLRWQMQHTIRHILVLATSTSLAVAA